MQKSLSKLDNKNSDFVTCDDLSKKVNINLASIIDANNTEFMCQCLMLLNFQLNISILKILQKKCKYIVLVDGGANKFFYTPLKYSQKVKVVIGDMDGIETQVSQFYQKRGATVIKDDDQDTTDFEKALTYVQKIGSTSTICLGVLGGRMDHTLSSLHITQKFMKTKPKSHLVLIGLGSIMTFLHENKKYNIEVNSTQINKEGCGLVTFSKIDHIETDGFKWNLGQKYQFKSLEWASFISTSNTIQKEVLQIQSSSPVFLICQLKNSTIELVPKAMI